MLCFKIDEVVFNDKYNPKFQTHLNNVLDKVGFKGGNCLGEKSINIILVAINNEIISNGYITSFIDIKPLNLKSGKIELNLNLDKIDKISINN